MKPAVILIVYAVLLVALGAYAFFSAPPGANAKTALIVTGGCAVLVMITAVLIARGSPSLARAAGIAGMVLPVLFTIIFAQRAFGITDPAKFYLRNVLWILAAVSVAAFIVMLAVRRQPTLPPAP